MTMNEAIEKFKKEQTWLMGEMRDWFHGLGTQKAASFTPEQAFEQVMKEQTQTFQEQLQFAKRAIQDGRKAKELLADEFVQTLQVVMRTKFDGLAASMFTTAKSMEDVSYARGWKDGALAWFTQLETIMKLGKGAEETLVELTKGKS